MITNIVFKGKNKKCCENLNCLKREDTLYFIDLPKKKSGYIKIKPKLNCSSQSRSNEIKYKIISNILLGCRRGHVPKALIMSECHGNSSAAKYI